MGEFQKRKAQSKIPFNGERFLDESKMGTLKVEEFKYTKGFNVNYTQRDNKLWTALHKASRLANPGVMKQLVDAGADVNAVGKQGYTPLMLSAFKGQMANVKLLVENGAKLDIRAKGDYWEGLTALGVAKRGGKDHVARYLTM